MGAKIKGIYGSFGWLLAVSLVVSGCETQKSLTRGRIKSTEKGLLRAVYIKGLKPEPLRLQDRMKFYQVPGVSLAVIDRSAIEWIKAYGEADIQTHELTTPEHRFQGGAFSQAVAAAVALRLVERGTLDIDADISGFFRARNLATSASPAKKTVSLRRLLAHSAGLAVQTYAGYLQPEPLPSLSLILAGQKPAKNVPIWSEFPPGERPRYSESNYVVLEQLITESAGEPFSKLAQEAVFGPLAMIHSTFEIVKSPAAPGTTASGHQRDGRILEGGWHNYPQAAAKGLWTTPSEFAAFAIDLLQAGMNKPAKILSPASARALLSPQAGNFGLGVSVDGRGDDVNFHLKGTTDGFSCLAVLYPAKGQGAVIMTNSDNGSILIDEILRALSAVYEWPDFKPEEKALYKLDSSIYQQYVGRYQVNPGYVMNVTQEDYYLIVQPTGQAATKFYVEGETLFFSVDPFIRIQFRKDKQGKVDSLVLWQQDFELEAKRIQ